MNNARCGCDAGIGRPRTGGLYDAARSVALLTAVLALTFSSAASAELYTDSLVSIDVPSGFQGPVSESFDSNNQTVAFSRLYTDREGGTLLQITRSDLGPKLLTIPRGQLSGVAAVYLSQFLAGVERRRTNFTVSEPMTLEIDGVPAVRAEWRGEMEGVEASGVMYCVIVQTTVVILHTQDVIGAPRENRASAIAAIETLRFNGQE